MKKIFSLLLFLLYVQSVGAIVQLGEVYDNSVRFFVYDDGTASIFDGKPLKLGSSGVYTVPRTVKYQNKDYTVTSILSYAFTSFYYNTDANLTLRVLNIPNTVEEIGDLAFTGCKNLVEVNLDDNMPLKSIGNQVFNETGITSF